jgi:hypothetical protein
MPVQVYPAMPHPIAFIAAAAILLATGCTTTRAPTTATRLEPKIRAQVEKGVIEPGFTPEMVFLALGKPSEPAESIVDATANGTWVYHNFKGTDRGLPKPGFRRRVVFDSARQCDSITTERIDLKASPKLQANSLYVTFRDGRVVEIQRVAEI